MKSIVKFLVLALGISWGFTGCYSYKVPAFDQLTFRYSDSSVPPRYHRSYTITVSARQCSVVVDVYGKNIVDKTYEVKQEAFDQLKELAQQLQRPGSYDQEQSGGSTKIIKLVNGKKIGYALFWDNSYTPKMAAQKLEKAIKGLIPDLDKLLKTPYGEDAG